MVYVGTQAGTCTTTLPGSEAILGVLNSFEQAVEPPSPNHTK
jgi:hypothetical protein